VVVGGLGALGVPGILDDAGPVAARTGGAAVGADARGPVLLVGMADQLPTSAVGGLEHRRRVCERGACLLAEGVGIGPAPRDAQDDGGQGVDPLAQRSGAGADGLAVSSQCLGVRTLERHWAPPSAAVITVTSTWP